MEYTHLNYDDASRNRFLRAVQDFLYGNPQSIRLRGQGVFVDQIQIIRGIWLGSKEDFAKILSLRCSTIGQGFSERAHYPPSYSTNYETTTAPEGMPDFGFKIDEFKSYR